MVSRFAREDRGSTVGPLRSLALAVWLLAVAGCSASEIAMKTTESAPAPPAAAPAASPADEAKPPAGGEVPPAESTKAAATVPAAAARKIIYNGRITLVVESVPAFGDQVARLVQEAGGYISQTDQASSIRSQQNASWIVRVPIDRFHAYLTAISKLGEVQEKHVESQDVTQEYYDIEARIANKLQEEKRLQKHLDDSTGKLEEILTVEREISRVRGEVEAMQGRIRYLANVTSLSTVTITATEVHNYVAPVTPTFAEQIARTFASSVENLVAFVQGITLIVVAIAPWIPILLLAALPFLIYWRRHRAMARRGIVFVPPGPGTT